MRFPHLLLAVTLCSRMFAQTPAAAWPEGLYATITTPRGELVVKLDYETAPLTVTNFVGLAEGKLGPHPGTPYFDGLTFHRVVPGFVIQGGDPTGTGEGGPGYEVPDEFSSALRHDAAGVISMANSGPDTNGSQFFITLTEVNRLNYLHSVFGRVVQGLDVLPAIEQGDTMTVTIQRIGPAATAFATDQAAYDERAARMPRAIPRHLDDSEGLLPGNPPWASILGYKLENLERALGAKLYLRLRSTRDPADADATLGVLAERWAVRCQTTTDGITSVYFADRDEWGLWIGEAQLARFTAGHATLHDAKAAFLDNAASDAADAIVQRFGTETPPPDQALKRQVDAIIDGLIPYLEP